jgi:hypothetical protein
MSVVCGCGCGDLCGVGNGGAELRADKLYALMYASSSCMCV